MKHHLSICAIVKNEYDYLLEWIAYHQVVGVNHFLIYNNSEKDDDGTTKLLKKLKRLPCIEVVPWPDKRKWSIQNDAYTRPQIPAYLDGLKRLRPTSDWVAFIDVDDFIVPMKEPDIPSTLKLYQQFGGVGANSGMFGFCAEKTKKNGPVCSRGTRAAAMECPSYRHVKCIVKPELVRAIGVRRPVLDKGLLVDEHG